MGDPTLLLLGLAVLAAVVVGGVRLTLGWLRRGADRRTFAVTVSVAAERQAWARERGWRYVPGPAAVAPDGLEPPGTRAPVEATHALVGTREGRAFVMATRAGEHVDAQGRLREWSTQSVEVAHRHPSPAAVLMAGAQDYAGPMPALVRERADLELVRSPLGLPWLVAAPVGLADEVTSALAGVLHADVPGGVAAVGDGSRVVVARPGDGSRRELSELHALAEEVAQALERVAVGY